MKRLHLILAALCLAFLIVSCSSDDDSGKIDDTPANQNTTTVQKYNLSITLNPVEGGSVERSDDGPSYEAGTIVTLTAHPEDGYSFLKWTGDINSEDSLITVTIDNDLSIIAEFKEEDTAAQKEQEEAKERMDQAIEDIKTAGEDFVSIIKNGGSRAEMDEAQTVFQEKAQKALDVYQEISELDFDNDFLQQAQQDVQDAINEINTAAAEAMRQR